MATAIETIAVGKLKLADDNIRQDLGDLRELAASIKAVGIIEPIIARDNDQLVVAGARRLAAAKQAGLKEVPVILRPFTEQERIETMVIENLQREDLTPLDEARAFKRLVDLGLTQRDVAARVGRAQSHVAKRLSLLTLPEEVQQVVDKGKLRLEDAQELTKIKDDPKLVARVAKKVTDGASPYVVTNTVTGELAKRDRNKQVEAAAKKLPKRDQEKLVKLGGDQYTAKPPKGMKLVTAKAPSFNEERYVVMDPAAHAKLPCHSVGLAVIYGHDGVQRYEVCTDPSQHPDPVKQRKDAEARKEADRDKREAAWTEMLTRRRQFAKTVIAGKIDQPLVLDACFQSLTATSYGFGGDRDSLAYLLLGNEYPKQKQEQKADGGGDVDLMEALRRVGQRVDVDEMEVMRKQAAKTGVERQRVMLALAIADIELALSRERWDADTASAYYELLGRLGYTPEKAEAAHLKAATS